MKVVFFHRKKPPAYFSIERYFENVRKHLPTSVTSAVAESSWYSNGLIHRLKIIWEARKRQGDVNHITGDIHFAALLLSRRKTILTIHDIGLIRHPSVLARFILGLIWVKWPVSRSRFVTAVSEATKNEIVSYTKCNPEKVHVIHTCIGSHFKRVDKPFNKENQVVLQIGTVANKNCIRMAEALAGIPCKLHIIGEPGPDYLEALRKFQINYSTFTRLTDEAVFEQYVGCDILLFASTLEGFGMPIIEANTVGRVVVTSNISSMPEVAKDAACLVDPFDVASIRTGIMKVINDDIYREQLVTKGFENAKRFDVSSIAHAYYKLYKRVVAN